jgi:nicotinamide-nucleotide adenylyltransferase
MKTCLFLGRFQPFHIGHLEVIKKLLKDYKLVVGIGSANISRSEMNPFTALERKEMILRVFKKEGIDAEVVTIDDIPIDDHYGDYLQSIVKFDILASSNRMVQDLLGKSTPIIMFPLFKSINATKIRQNICNNKDYKEYLHEEVYYYFKEINAEEIIKKIGYYRDE